MAVAEDDDIDFEIGSQPKSCLELLNKMRDLESFVVSKISWRAEWPPVDQNIRNRLAFRKIEYIGQTQTPDQALLAEHRTRSEEFRKVHRTLRNWFGSVDLPGPEVPMFEPLDCNILSEDIASKIHEAREEAERFWVRLCESIQSAVFKRNELVRNWAPQVLPPWTSGEPLATQKIFPPFPIRSLLDMENWLKEWLARCSKPENRNHPATPSVGGGFKNMTIVVPDVRPPFRRPVEQIWRCSFDDLSREVRNFRRACADWGLESEIKVEGNPMDFSAAEDRLLTAISSLQILRRTVSEVLCANGSSEVEVRNLSAKNIPGLMASARLNASQNKAAKRAARKKTNGKIGRPPGAKADLIKSDKRIAVLWKGGKGNFITKEDLAKELKMSLEEVRKAIDRHRHREANLGKSNSE